MRRMLRALALVILAIVVVLGVSVTFLWLLLATEPGQNWLDGKIEALLGAPGRKVSIALARDSFFFHPRVDTLDVADSGGIWMSARDIAIDISPTALLHRRLDIERFDVGEVLIRRQPSASKAGTDWTTSLAMPRLPLAVSLREFRVVRLLLARPVLGQPVTLALYGQGTDAPDHLDLTAALDRRDGQPGGARLTLTYDPASTARDHLDLGISVSDPSGIIVRSLQPGAGLLPLDLSIQGSGPASAWRGIFQAKAGGASQVVGTLQIDQDKTGSSVSFDSKATVGPILPGRLRRMFGKDLALAVEFRLPDKGAPTLTRLMGRAAMGSVNFRSGPGSPSGSVNGVLQSDIVLASFSDLVGQRLDGHAEIEATVGGSAVAPRLSARIVTQGLAIAGSRIDKTQTQITMSGGDWTAAQGFATGELSSISVPSGRLPAPLAQDILWSAELSVGTTDRVIEI